MHDGIVQQVFIKSNLINKACEVVGGGIASGPEEPGAACPVARQGGVGARGFKRSVAQEPHLSGARVQADGPVLIGFGCGAKRLGFSVDGQPQDARFQPQLKLTVSLGEDALSPIYIKGLYGYFNGGAVRKIKVGKGGGRLVGGVKFQCVIGVKVLHRGSGERLLFAVVHPLNGVKAGGIGESCIVDGSGVV